MISVRKNTLQIASISANNRDYRKMLKVDGEDPSKVFEEDEDDEEFLSDDEKGKSKAKGDKER